MDFINNYLSYIANLITIGGFVFTIHKSAKKEITGKALINFSNHILSLIFFSFSVILLINFIWGNASTISLILMLIFYILHIYFTCILLYKLKKAKSSFFLFISIIILTLIVVATIIIWLYTRGVEGIIYGAFLAFLILFLMGDILFCITVFKDEQYCSKR